jgi:hypothetical protein
VRDRKARWSDNECEKISMIEIKQMSTESEIKMMKQNGGNAVWGIWDGRDWR